MYGEQGNDLSRRIRAGLVFWNCYHVVDVAAPFGMIHDMLLLPASSLSASDSFSIPANM
jgi:acyl-CoA reductase-like NAD-dependent aldehyde dehydrogenase